LGGQIRFQEGSWGTSPLGSIARGGEGKVDIQKRTFGRRRIILGGIAFWEKHMKGRRKAWEKKGVTESTVEEGGKENIEN